MNQPLMRSAVVLVLVVWSGAAFAAPSSQVWIPSTDTQPFKTMNIGIDNFFRDSAEPEAPSSPGANRDANTLDVGLTFGVLPFDKLRLEIGCDYLVTANDPNDQHPWSGNLKLATPEEALFHFAPALAIGIYNARPVNGVASSDAPKVVSGQNVMYGLVAKTAPAFGGLPSLGRFSAGYYGGARRALVNEHGEVANHGVLLSWDRVLKELSEKLWIGLDYMGGDNVNGAFNAGFSWKFASNLSLLFGYDRYTKHHVAGANTFTLQVNITVPHTPDAVE